MDPNSGLQNRVGQGTGVPQSMNTNQAPQGQPGSVPPPIANSLPSMDGSAVTQKQPAGQVENPRAYISPQDHVPQQDVPDVGTHIQPPRQPQATDLSPAKQQLRQKLMDAPDPSVPVQDTSRKVNLFNDDKPEYIRNVVPPKPQGQTAPMAQKPTGQQAVQSSQPAPNIAEAAQPATAQVSARPKPEFDTTPQHKVPPPVGATVPPSPTSQHPVPPPPTPPLSSVVPKNIQSKMPHPNIPQNNTNEVANGQTPPPTGGTMATAKPKKKFPWAVLIIIVLLILIGGGVGYAYWKQLGPFAKPPFSEENLLSGIVQSYAKLDSAKTTITLSFTGEPREPGAEPFVSSVTADDAYIAALRRDKTRFDSLTNIVFSILDDYYVESVYPAVINTTSEYIDLDQDDIAEFTYVPTEDGQDYTLSVTFETDDAIKAIKDSYGYNEENTTITNDKTVIFTSTSDAGYYYFTGRPDVPWIVDLLTDENLFEPIPSDIDLALELSAFVTRDETNTDTEMQAVFNGVFSDISIAADVEAKKVGDVYYFFISKFPSFFFDISAIKNKWIELPEDNLSRYDSYFGVGESDQDEFEKIQKEMLEQATHIVRVAESQKLFYLEGGPLQVNRDGKVLYEYNIKIDPKKIAPFYKQLSQEFENTYGEDALFTFDEVLHEELQEPVLEEVLDYLNQNKWLVLLANAQGDIVEVESSIRIVPPDDSGHQFVFSIKEVFEELGSDYKITKPEDTINIDEAELLLRGITREELNAERQLQNVQTLQRVLDEYYFDRQGYPLDLSSLQTDLDNYDETYLDVIPYDIIADTSYGYQPLNNNQDYALIYTMVDIPPSDLDSVYLITQSETIGNTWVYRRKFVDGQNTANKESLSVEAATAVVDTDGDLLDNELEAYFGTSPNVADTDGDGVDDYDEVFFGSDPLDDTAF